MKNFIIFLYFVFLFKLTIAESLPNLPGLESAPSVDDTMIQAPAFDDENAMDSPFPQIPAEKGKTKKSTVENNSIPEIIAPTMDSNPQEVTEEAIPMIDLPEDNSQTTELPDSTVRQAMPLNQDPQNNVGNTADPFPVAKEEDKKPVFDEFKAEQPYNAMEENGLSDKRMRKIESSENFPETPELDFSGKKIQKTTSKELSAEEREKQVDDLLNSVIGEDEEENISAEDLLSDKKDSEISDDNPKIETSEKPQDFQNIRRRVGYTPNTYTEEQLVDQLVKASMRGDKATVVALLHSGRKANSANRFGETPLMGAIYNGHADIIEILVAEGANANANDSKGNTPLHVAVARKNYMAVQQLLRAGAEANAKNISGDTPLLIATLNNSLDIVDLLVREGADVNKSNSDGLTPLHISTYNNNIEIVKYLLYVGANANMVNRDGLKPYDLAYGKNLDIARLLLSYTGPQRYVSGDLQQMIQQKNLPVTSPVQPTQTADQFSMFPKTYVEAEEKAMEQEQAINERQDEWWAARKTAQSSVSQVSNSESYQPASLPASTLSPEQISQFTQSKNQQPAYVNAPVQQQVPQQQVQAPQVPKSMSNEISLDSNDIRQQPRSTPASMKINNIETNAPYRGASNINAEKAKAANDNAAMGSLLSPSQALTTLSGGMLKYADMTPQEQKSWNEKLEKWIRLGESIETLDPKKLSRFKKLGKVLESIYQQQLGMNAEKIKNKIAYENFSQQVYGERRRPANPDKMNLTNMINRQNTAPKDSAKVDNYLKSIYASSPDDIIIEY